ncbi:MAG: hypothetical protein CMJ89_03770 [Planctomycetes bacterium]|jgi:hypothetical protein|nr:hypothetical protein [Planctomycetota bacterium]
MSEEMTMSQPTVEHNRLQELAGVWDVDCKFYMDPSHPPVEFKGKETIEMFGNFWTQSLFEADMFGTPLNGRCTLGYDPNKGEYVSTWIDTMSPTLFKFTGNFDAKNEVLEMHGRAFDFQLKTETNYRTTEVYKSPDERLFEMFMEMPNGREVKMFTYAYQRVR